LVVKSTASPEAVKEIESFVNESISSVSLTSKDISTQIVLILAMMNIAENYLMLLKKCEQDANNREASISIMMKKLSEAV
jgi:cell division protein ZapA